MTRGRWLEAAAIFVVTGLLAGRWLAVTTADRLWAEALAVGATHGHLRELRTVLLLTAFLVAAVWCLGNLYIIYRSIRSVHVPRRIGNLEFFEAVSRRYLLLAAVGLGLLLAIALSYNAGEWWYARALANYRASLGVVDPILGRDLSDYLFRLPWQRTMHSFATLLAGIILGLAAVFYGAMGAIRWRRGRVRVADLARWHLAALLGVFALTLFWGYRLEPLEYVAGIHHVPADTVLTEVRLPAARMLSALALVAALAALVWLWTPRTVVVAVPWAVLGLVSLAGHYLVPAFAGAVRTPEELRLPEAEAARARYLELAYGAPVIETPLDPVATSRPGALLRRGRGLERAPVWDPFAVTLFLNRAAPGAPGHRFTDARLGAYPGRDGTVIPVFVAARAVDLAAADREEGTLSWEDVHVGPHAVASGAVAVSGYGLSSTGLPLFVPDLTQPDAGVPEVTELGLRVSAMVFRPGAFDFAVRAPDGDVAGVPAGGLFRRLALAWALQSPQLLNSDRVADTALVVWERDVVRRLNRFAPFARFEAAVPVIEDGRLQWVANGIVAAEAFPLTAAVGWQDQTVRYLRGSLVGVVDAGSGETVVYLTRDADPLSVAWGQLAPELVRPASHLPAALLPHLRYPEATFAAHLGLVRRRVLRALGSEPVPSRRGAGLAGDMSWWVGPSPSDTVSRVRLLAPVEDEDATFLAAVLDGTVREGRPVLEIFRLEAPLEIPGPTQMGRRFARLRAELAAVEGRVRAIPYREGILAIQASYASPGEGFAAPQLVDVAVGWGTAVGNGPTLADALQRLQSQVPTPGAAGAEWSRARRWFERMDAARRAGDWVAFGQAYDALRRLFVGTTDTVP